ncbi:MAG: AI-2E family transporter, partial [Anaerolineae bacterium]
MGESVPRWSTGTKRIVVVSVLVLLALVTYRFRVVIPPLVIALLLAFILDPLVDFVTDRLHLSRGGATVLVFLLLIVVGLGVMAAPVTAIPSIQRAVRSVQIDFIRIIADIGAFFERPVDIGGYSLDLSSVYGELSALLSRFVGSVAQGTLDIAFGIASGAFWLFFILMSAFYMVKDADRVIDQLDDLAPPGYRDDFVRLRLQITEGWNAFLRGQLLLGLALAAITTAVCLAVGLP